MAKVKPTEFLLKKLLKGKAQKYVKLKKIKDAFFDMMDRFNDQTEGVLIFNRLQFNIVKKDHIKVKFFLDNHHLATLKHDVFWIDEGATITFELDQGIMQMFIE